ncbi:hypothetical protein LCGC14_0313180 [marine sediment metagenome]|uniref:Uncharacterized protein n=1 Tax=marine sediment metagenome TaxID=412755 RepID=A0A0F9W8P5_9ZZZZ
MKHYAVVSDRPWGRYAFERARQSERHPVGVEYEDEEICPFDEFEAEDV